MIKDQCVQWGIFHVYTETYKDMLGFFLKKSIFYSSEHFSKLLAPQQLISGEASLEKNNSPEVVSTGAWCIWWSVKAVFEPRSHAEIWSLVLLHTVVCSSLVPHTTFCAACWATWLVQLVTLLPVSSLMMDGNHFCCWYCCHLMKQDMRTIALWGGKNRMSCV